MPNEAFCALLDNFRFRKRLYEDHLDYLIEFQIDSNNNSNRKLEKLTIVSEYKMDANKRLWIETTTACYSLCMRLVSHKDEVCLQLFDLHSLNKNVSPLADCSNLVRQLDLRTKLHRASSTAWNIRHSAYILAHNSNREWKKGKKN